MVQSNGLYTRNPKGDKDGAAWYVSDKGFEIFRFASGSSWQWCLGQPSASALYYYVLTKRREDVLPPTSGWHVHSSTKRSPAPRLEFEQMPVPIEVAADHYSERVGIRVLLDYLCSPAIVTGRCCSHFVRRDLFRPQSPVAGVKQTQLRAHRQPIRPRHRPPHRRKHPTTRVRNPQLAPAVQWGRPVEQRQKCRRKVAFFQQPAWSQVP